jgi:maleate isomerase
MTETIRRFGVLVPPANVTVEDEFPHYLPGGVRFHTGRLYRSALTLNVDTLTEMVESTEAAAQRVAQVAPEVIAWACTSGSFLEGHGGDLELAGRIEKTTGIPAITTSTAVVDALKAVNANRVYLVTPYVAEINEREETFLADHGFQVTHTASFLYPSTDLIRDTGSDKVSALIMAERDRAGAFDTVFISCTQLHSMDRIFFLEETLEVPVITSNSATLWATLRHMNLDTRGLGGGRLFEQ